MGDAYTSILVQVRLPDGLVVCEYQLINNRPGSEKLMKELIERYGEDYQEPYPVTVEYP